MCVRRVLLDRATRTALASALVGRRDDGPDVRVRGVGVHPRGRVESGAAGGVDGVPVSARRGSRRGRSRADAPQVRRLAVPAACFVLVCADVVVAVFAVGAW